MIDYRSMQAIIFCRVSSKDQEFGYSLSAQKSLLVDYCKRNKFNIVDTIELAETASKELQRKVFKQVIDRLNKDKSLTEFVVEKTDRLSRNFSDVLQTDAWIKKGDNNRLHLVKQNLTITKNSRSDDVFIWRIETAIAERGANNISEEVRKGMNQKALEGWYPNNRKFGYKLVLKDGRKVWEKDPLESQFVERMFRLYVDGMSLRELRKIIYQQGLQRLSKPISVSYIQRVLRDPFYIGKFNWGGVTYDGKHEAIISSDVYYKAQDLLDGKNHPNTTKRFFIYGKGLLRCHNCSHYLTGELQKGTIYYRCHHCKGQSYQKEDLISTRILEHLSKFEVTSPRLLDWVKDALGAYRDEEYLFNQDIIRNLVEEMEAVKKERKMLYKDYKKGIVTYDFYHEQWDDYTEQIKNFEASIAAENRSEDLSYKLATSIFELASKAKYLWLKKFTPQQKWQFLKLAASNLTMQDDYLDIAYKNGFNVLYNSPKKTLVSRTGQVSNNFIKELIKEVRHIKYPTLVYQELQSLHIPLNL